MCTLVCCSLLTIHVPTICYLRDYLICLFCNYIPQGWLIDFVNHFGMLGGFKLLKERICEGGSLSVSLLAALIRYCSVTFSLFYFVNIKKKLLV